MGSVLADATFLGVHVDGWTLFGLCSNVLFTSRFVVQWIASERRKTSVIPLAFWWLSIFGSLIQGIYFIFKANPETGTPDPDLVGILGSVFGSVVYTRNLFLIHKRKGMSGAPSTPGAPREAAVPKDGAQKDE